MTKMNVSMCGDMSCDVRQGSSVGNLFKQNKINLFRLSNKSVFPGWKCGFGKLTPTAGGKFLLYYGGGRYLTASLRPDRKEDQTKIRTKNARGRTNQDAETKIQW
jgi:hypothetical protein